jgi:superfamily I DNA/RNA helicase/Zn-dependent peptidase ImmA (M78 family)
VDAFDKVRELARAKNREALMALHAEPKALDLVRALVATADLELYCLDETDALLNGALAVLARDDGAIYHVKNASNEDLALLIAHELGHFHSHTAESTSRCSNDDVDVSAPSEASPVGADRVAGYGARERRELQANVFARELLLPQPQARALYLDQGKLPESIAADLGVPLAIVRQQLIDALLIPVHEVPEAEGSREDPPLDPTQQKAAEFSGAPLLLEAGPGTGKTRTVVARIVHLLQSGTPASSIIALTFSNKAAQELSERVAVAVPESAANIWTGTFHAFGLELVRKYHDHAHLGYPADVRVIDKSDAVAFLEEVLPLLPLVHYKNLWDPLINLKDILSAISRAKDELVAPAAYRELAQRMLDRAADEDSRIAAEKALEVAAVYERYETLLGEQKLLDFGDLIMKPTLLLESDPLVRDALRMQFRHVLVDEYQDVNRASARLLKALAGSGERLWVVGDARQSIYRFRGASSANMARFVEDFQRAVRLSLGKNYRSTQEVVDTYCSFSRTMGASSGMQSLALTANRGTGLAPELRQVPDEDVEEAALAASVEELRKSGVPLRKQAILFRTNPRLSQFAAALEKRGIPALHLGSLFERDEIRNLLSLLSLVAHSSGSALVRLATLDRYRAPLADVERLLSHCRDTRTRALDALKHVADIEAVSPAARGAFAALARDLEGFNASSSPWEMLCKYLFERSDLVRPLSQSHDVRDQMKCVAIWQFLNFIREPHGYGKGPPIFRLLERIRHLVVLGDERDLRQIPSGARHADAVRMLTIHGSKGLEFEAVHVTGMTKGRLPLKYQGIRCPPPDGMLEEAGSASGKEHHRSIHGAEEECLYFVAMSRARSYLRHYGSAESPSDFIAKVPLLTPARGFPLASAQADTSKEWIVPVIAGASGSIDADELNRFDRCPRRFLYTSLLGLAGRQRETPFVKTHDCVYETIRAAKEQNRAADRAWLIAQLDTAWKDSGPSGHAYEKDYREIAEQTIANFQAACEGLDLREIETFAVDLVNGKVEVIPDQIARRQDGTTVLRRIRTGKLSDTEQGEWIYTFYHAAGTKRYGAGRYEVEAIHLTGNTRTKIDPSRRVREARIEKATEAAQNILAGDFLPKPNTFTCPRCPHFFYCPSIPEGAVQLP